MKKVLKVIPILLILMSVAALAAGSWALSETATWGAITPTNPSIKYGGTFRPVLTWGPMTNSINPLSPTSQLPCIGDIYEPLFYDNPLTGQITPLLGVNYKWEDNNLELIVKTRSGVKWSDGVPFTAEDVAFTFNYIKKYPGLDTNGIWSSVSSLQTVEASGNNIVVFTFSKPNVTLFYYIAQQLIVPEHIWSKINDPMTFTNTANPVGTGPFLFKNFDVANNVAVLVKNPNYWLKGRPYIDGIEYYSLTGSLPLLYLLKGKADSSNMGSGMNPYTEWQDKNPSTNKFWWPIMYPTNLYLNTLKYPFNIVTFRKAVEIALDKNSMDQKAYFGLAGAANPTGIIPDQMNEWFDPSLTAAASELNSYDPQKAQQLLASIGFKKNSSGQLCDPSGKPLPTYNLLIGAGWGDYISMAQVISQNLKAIGIDVNIEPETYGAYESSFESGTYDMGLRWGSGYGPTPYYFYNAELNPSFSATKIGETAIGDFARYTNPAITEALKTYMESSDINVQKQAIYTIEKYMINEVPFIPVTGEMFFNEYWEGNLVGFPSASDPYMPAAYGEPLTLNIHLK